MEKIIIMRPYLWLVFSSLRIKARMMQAGQQNGGTFKVIDQLLWVDQEMQEMAFVFTDEEVLDNPFTSV